VINEVWEERMKRADFLFCTLNLCLEIFKEIARFSWS